MKYLYPIALFLVLIVGLRLSIYTVDAAEFAYVTVLGEHMATYDGADGDSGAGLHIGWPWPAQSVQRLDRRLQQFDLPATELLTHDPEGKTIDKMLLVDAYVCWRIADSKAVDLFVRRIGNVERANAILEPRIRSELGAAIGQMTMDDLVSADIVPGTGKTRVDLTVEGLHERLLAALKDKVKDEYGIDLVDVRLRRFSHPAQVRDSIFERIKSERAEKASKYISEGDLKARNIETKADEEKSGMLAKAHYEEVKIKGDADAEAMRIRNDAHQKDPEFYAFLKQMEKLQSILGDNKTVLLLSTNRPLFERLFQPPRPEGEPRKIDGPEDKKKAVPDSKKGGPG
jgi:modulator of FtsH protease HflC